MKNCYTFAITITNQITNDMATIKSTSIKCNGRETNYFTPNTPIAETEKAIQLEVIRFTDMETVCKTWFPKSQIKFNPNEGLVEIPEWLLLTKTNANRLTMYI